MKTLNGHSLILVLLMAMTLNAQTLDPEPKPVTPTEFEILSPYKVLVYSPLELNVPGDYDFRQWSCSPLAHFQETATGAIITAPPGVHTVTFRGARIDWVNKKVDKMAITTEYVFDIEEAPPADPDTPDTPDNPDTPQDDIDYDKVSEVSFEAAAELNDPTTAERIHDATVAMKYDGTVEQIRERWQKVVGSVLLTRTGASRAAKWRVWRTTVSTHTEALSDRLTPETYKRVLLATVKPLSGTGGLSRPIGLATVAPVTPAVISLYIPPNCPAGEQWKKTHKAACMKLGPGFGFRNYLDPTGVGCQLKFVIRYGNRIHTYKGFLTPEILQSLIDQGV